VRKKYRRTCWLLALEAGLSVPDYAGADGKIAVRLDFFPPDRSARDDDNAEASFKSGRDGVADAMRCDDARFRTIKVLHDEPRSCVVFSLIEDTHQ
jgi:crossover junction endodeoxyribonuclease RusA